jgi:hypothetical protein
MTRTNICTLWIGCTVLAIAQFAHIAGAAEPLGDAELDAITAGAADETGELLEFNVKHETASGRRIEVDGALNVDRVRSLENATLLLQDSAQSNLQSLININAVQSAVNVLVNLNITIDSNVGEIRQLNLGSVSAPPGN